MIAGKWYKSDKWGRVLCCGTANPDELIPAYAVRIDGHTVMKYISDKLPLAEAQCWEDGDNCSFADCTKNAEVFACGRETFIESNPGHPIPARYCKEHAEVVTDERGPEYTDTCPNCGCLFGVN